MLFCSNLTVLIGLFCCLSAVTVNYKLDRDQSDVKHCDVKTVPPKLRVIHCCDVDQFTSISLLQGQSIVRKGTVTVQTAH